MDLQLKDKTVLISGSARGTGYAMAAALINEGAKVVIHGQEQHKAQEAALSSKAFASVWGDLSCGSGAQQVIDQCLDLIGAPDILINNYGTAMHGKWGKLSSEQWLEAYQHNVLSGVRLIEGFLPDMRQKSWGRIIQIGTMGNQQPNDIMPHYYAAKGAQANMTVSLAKALAGTGITVNTVSPGLIHTPELETFIRAKGQKNNWGEDWAQIEAQFVKQYYSNPCGRFAKTEEVADLVAFIASPKANYINGQNMTIDGGALGSI
jgi:3-oxoacyl-[acyl-carrier protein] reductase